MLSHWNVSTFPMSIVRRFLVGPVVFFLFVPPLAGFLNGPLDAQELRNLQVSSSSLGIQFGDWFVFKGGEWIDQVDFNQDGDLQDQVPHLYHVPTGEIRTLGVAAFSLPWVRDLSGRYFAFSTAESAEGSTDLNGDGDVSDRRGEPR